MDEHSVDEDDDDDDDNNNNNNEAVEATPPSLRKIQSMRNSRLKTDPQLGKVQDALEHIVVTGTKIYRDEWRKRRFEESVKTSGETISSAKGRRKRPRPPTTDASTYHHAEDLRIYGNRDAVPPENRKEQQQYQWNLEHGDSVPPIHFRMARLSGEYPSEDQLRSLQSHGAVNEAHVPRALIEHCWERAVHVASNTLMAPVTTTTTTNPTTSNIDTESSSSSLIHFDASTPLSREECLQRCKSLGIDLNDSERTKISTNNASHNPSCPRCTRSFATKAALEHHYYGDTDTLGCCRPLVRPKHLDLIRTLLQDHVRSQTDRLLEIVLSSSTQTNATAHNSNDDDNDDNASATEDNDNDGSETASKKEPAPQRLDWKEVQSSLKRAVDDSAPLSTTAVARHPVQESLRIDTESNSSLVLNPMIVEAVHRRLIDRYAHVPR